MLPKIKKKISSFLLGEEGKIQKQSLIAIGSVLAGSAFAALLSKQVSAAHVNNLILDYDASSIIAKHAHHQSHGSHSSHASGGHASGY